MRSIAVLLALLAAVPAPLRAAGVGTTGAGLLKVQAGARSLAMGGAGTALAGDLSALLVNPAMLAPVGARSLMLMHWPGVADNRTEYASYSVPLGSFGIWAGSVLFRSLPDIANQDAIDEPVAVSDGAILMTFARRMGGLGGAGGVSIKVFNSALGDIRATSVAVDLGMLSQGTGRYPIRYGLSITNLGNPIKHLEAGEPLPITVRGGLSWTRGWYPHALTVAADALLNTEQNTKVAVGVEWLQAGHLAVRAGGSYNRYGGTSFTLGGGWQFRSTVLGPEAEYHLDYAYLPFRVIDSFEPTNCFSLFVKF
ncbi:MAG: PorV/PorQ family protein [Candidatus Coatesbacteria bacterium]